MSAEAYPSTLWNGYARSHASVTTSFQLSLYREAAGQLGGDVLDCGCGTARLAPFLADDPGVTSYTGVDLAPDMVRMARWTIERLDRERFVIEQGAIEAVQGQFDSLVSIHSYYAWPRPLDVLAHIRRLMRSGGRFVLATPNRRLDMERLLRESSRELLAHPDFPEFERLNLAFAGNPGAAFVDMDLLIGQSRDAGFAVLECHQRHYLGGVNLLVLSTP
ncbi:class I SAM-dependent methyltransferase [Imhoffiella purpurea]|uniref:Uncharacterized protein n=1 Tax=Imhoffiella purpurea TaxID=1249627 RepID=W9V1W2_9GAMM|nr:class I SAM-dependent methyltransferase [Imhoffiella purpurea]EXJ13304.1 hypothetical protein D779_3895 [Imhoffiella purpurea]